MKLKPTKKGLKNLIKEEVKEEPKKTSKRGKKENSLPSDEYKPMFDPIRFLVRETRSNKDSTKMIKQYVELSVKRFNDDAAMPYVWISMYQESEFYTGYLKGHTAYLPLEMLYDLIDNLTELSETCDRLKIE